MNNEAGSLPYQLNKPSSYLRATWCQSDLLFDEYSGRKKLAGCMKIELDQQVQCLGTILAGKSKIKSFLEVCGRID